jgi:hypothetical protein
VCPPCLGGGALLPPTRVCVCAQDHISNKLSQDTHPYLQAPPEAAAAAPHEEAQSLRKYVAALCTCSLPRSG